MALFAISGVSIGQIFAELALKISFLQRCDDLTSSALDVCSDGGGSVALPPPDVGVLSTTSSYQDTQSIPSVVGGSAIRNVARGSEIQMTIWTIEVASYCFFCLSKPSISSHTFYRC